MSESLSTQSPVSSGTAANAGPVETAKSEAGEVKSTAFAEAGQVAETARDEAATVAREAKAQVRDLYAQTRHELQEQAAQQQQRAADGLRSLGEELEAMVQSSDASGIAPDLVRQASSRVSKAATWLGERDPGSLVTEVKGYARRHPGVFITAAAIAGVAAGRLTRALASDAQQSSSSSSQGSVPSNQGSVGAATPSTPSNLASGTPSNLASSAPTSTSPSAATPLYDAARGAQEGR